MRFVPADDPREAAAVREIDLERKYHISASDLARSLDLTAPRALALRRHLGIDADEGCRHVFVFDSQRIPRYSDAALQRMRDALDEVTWTRSGRSIVRAAGPPRDAGRERWLSTATGVVVRADGRWPD